jgi:hypothetical protein
MRDSRLQPRAACDQIPSASASPRRSRGSPRASPALPGALPGWLDEGSRPPQFAAPEPLAQWWLSEARVSTTSRVGSLVWECPAIPSGSNLDQVSEAQREGAGRRGGPAARPYLKEHPPAIATEIAASLHTRRQRVQKLLESDGRFTLVQQSPDRKANARCWALADMPVPSNGTGRDRQAAGQTSCCLSHTPPPSLEGEGRDGQAARPCPDTARTNTTSDHEEKTDARREPCNHRRED